MKSYLLIAIFSLISSVVVAQIDTCITNLKNAGNDYDQGNYDHAISTLKSTLKGCDLTKHDKIEANKLLILSYLRIDKLEAADSAATTIMKIDPSYTPDKFKDDPRLSSLFGKFKPKPSLAISIAGGINIPRLHVVHTYSVVHADDAGGLASYKSLAGFQMKAGIEKRAYKNLWLEAGFEFRKTIYKHVLDSVQGNTVSYTENLNYFDFPLSVKYYFLQTVFTPYVEAGADFSFLSRALSTTTRPGQKDIVDRSGLRNNFDIGYFGGAGVSYTIKSLKVFGDIRYTYFPGLVNKTGTRYADNINLYKYYYVDDDFKMDNFQFNVGLSYILFYRIFRVK